MASRQASLPFILITVFIDVMGIGLMIPVLPSLIGELAGSPDLQSYWFGALMVTFGLAQFFAMPVLGALSDRYGRRPLLLLSIFGLGIAYLVTATTHSLIILLLSRVLSGATSASFTVANAYVADITTPENRSKGFGAIGAAFGIGFIFGPMIGGLLASHDLRLPFWVAAGLSLTNWLYGFFVLPESLALELRQPVKFSQVNPFGSFSHLWRLKGVGLLILVFALTGLAQWLLNTTWVLYTSFRFHWKPVDNGMALFLVGLTAALVQGVLIGRLIKRFGDLRLAQIGLLSAATVYTGYGLATVPWLMYVLIPMNCLSFAIMPALQGLISNAATREQQGLTQGSLNAITSITTVAAPLIGTPLLAMVAHLPANDWRMGITFFVGAGLQLSALILTVVHFRGKLRTASAST